MICMLTLGFTFKINLTNDGKYPTLATRSTVIIYRYSDRKHDNTLLSIYSTNPSCSSWSVNTVWATILPGFVFLSFSCQKSRENTYSADKWKSKSGQWTTVWRFTESGLGIRSSSLDSPPPRAGFEQVQIARFRWTWVSVWWREVRRPPAPLSAIKVVVKLYHACYYIAIRWTRFAGSLEDCVSQSCRIVSSDQIFRAVRGYLMEPGRNLL